MKIQLTSTETAALLDVHPSTVKRWCNDGELDSEQTPGGHRRIGIDAAVRFARNRGIRTILTPFHPFEPHVWTALRALEVGGAYEPLHTLALQWVGRGELERLEQLYLALGRADFLPFHDYCDHAVRDLMRTVGDEWENGRLRVGDEHMVSQAMTGALYALRREWIDRRDGGNGDGRPSRPVAVVGTLEGNAHQLGALCVRTLLERRGWQVFYPAGDVPIQDFGTLQMSREASLVCISLPSSGSVGDVRRVVDGLRGIYDRARPYSLVFGGPSDPGIADEAREGPFRSVVFLEDCAALGEAVDGGLGLSGIHPRLPGSPPHSSMRPS